MSDRFDLLADRLADRVAERIWAGSIGLDAQNGGGAA